MEIVKRRQVGSLTLFRDLAKGDVFRLTGGSQVRMKCSNSREVCLETGDITDCWASSSVFKLLAKLYIYE